MTNIFSAISAKIFAGLAVALLVYSGWTQLQLWGARSALKDATIQIVQLEADKRLANAQIENWKRAADERKANADKALEAAQNQTVIHTERSNTIMRESPVGEQCAATLRLLEAYQK